MTDLFAKVQKSQRDSKEYTLLEKLMIRLHRLANHMGEKIIETDRMSLEEAEANDELFFLE